MEKYNFLLNISKLFNFHENQFSKGNLGYYLRFESSNEFFEVFEVYEYGKARGAYIEKVSPSKNSSKFDVSFSRDFTKTTTIQINSFVHDLLIKYLSHD